MKSNNKSSYVNGTYGRIHLNVLTDGVVLVQDRADGTSGSIALSIADIDKLARALFVKKKDFSPSFPSPKSAVPVAPAPIKTKQPSSYMAQQKAQYQQAYAKWSPDEEARLKDEFANGKTIPEMATQHGRGEGAIRTRLVKLGLIKE
jgi:hypothetical protein